MQRGTASSVPQKRPLSAIFSGANVTLYARDFLSIEKRNQAVYDTTYIFASNLPMAPGSATAIVTCQQKNMD